MYIVNENVKVTNISWQIKMFDVTGIDMKIREWKSFNPFVEYITGILFLSCPCCWVKIIDLY